MKRRSFVVQTGKLLVYAPILLPVVSAVSCKKSSSATGTPDNPGPTKTPVPTSGPPSLPPGVVATLAPGQGATIIAIPNSHILNGYVDKQSYLPGEYCTVYLSANNIYNNQKITVNNINNTLAFSIPIVKATSQQMQTDNPSINGYGYDPSVTFLVPAVASGVYLIANSIPLIIRGTNANVDFTIVYPSNTENAYCLSGGFNLYGPPNIRTVSFLRPIPMSYYAGGFFKWVSQQSYTYNVIADIDVDNASNIMGKMLIIPGHSEYWTRTARENFDKHVDSGKPALILSGNTMFWQVRYNDNGNQMICYKSAVLDTTPSPLDKTILWTDPSLQYPVNKGIGADSHGGGYGGPQSSKSFQGIKIQYPASPLYNGLNLKMGDVITCSSHELDGAPISGYDANGFPIIDNSNLGFYQVELIGYDFAADYFIANKFNTATAVVFRKTQSSGVVLNMATTSWCVPNYFTGVNNKVIPVITKNAINLLLDNVDPVDFT